LAADRKTARNRTPIAWHPLFPAMLAVWFGALFGLSVLAVRVSLLERLAVASGIDRILPAATPPLGANARILIALGLALVGGMIGAAIGSLLARSKPSAVARRAEAAAARAAASAEAAEPVAALAAADAPGFIDISQLDLDEETRSPFAPVEPKPADRTEAPVIEAAPEAAAAEPEAVESEAEPEPALKPARRPDPAYFPLPAAFPVPGGAAAQRLIAAELDDLSHLELIERLALSLQKRRQDAPVYLDAPSAEALAIEPEAEPAAEAAAPPAPQVPSYYPPAPEPVAARPAAPAPATAEPSEPGAAIALFPEPTAAAPRQDSAATERALRDALSALQRMSGAA